MAAMNLNTTASVNPIIWKGNSNSQINGKRKIKAMAMGQQRDSKINQRMTAKMIFIFLFIS